MPLQRGFAVAGEGASAHATRERAFHVRPSVAHELPFPTECLVALQAGKLFCALSEQRCLLFGSGGTHAGSAVGVLTRCLREIVVGHARGRFRDRAHAFVSLCRRSVGIGVRGNEWDHMLFVYFED